MPEFHSTVTIARPRGEVYAYVIDSDTQTIWQSGSRSSIRAGRMSPTEISTAGKSTCGGRPRTAKSSSAIC